MNRPAHTNPWDLAPPRDWSDADAYRLIREAGYRITLRDRINDFVFHWRLRRALRAKPTPLGQRIVLWFRLHETSSVWAGAVALGLLSLVAVVAIARSVM